MELKPLTLGEYNYPEWSRLLGWIITCSSLSCIPIYAVYHFWHAPGENFFEKAKKSFQPAITVSSTLAGEILEENTTNKVNDLNNHPTNMNLNEMSQVLPMSGRNSGGEEERRSSNDTHRNETIGDAV